MSFSNANDSIVRYIRFRMGKGGDSGKGEFSFARVDTMDSAHKLEWTGRRHHHC